MSKVFSTAILLLSFSAQAYDTERASPSDFKETKNVTKTIVITKSGSYDFKNVLHVWKGKGKCNQQENQPYVLRIAASNVTIKNFAYINAPDGIHIGTSSKGQGHSDGKPISNITLENVTGWACEDALTTQYGVGNVTIKDSKFHGNPNASYRDKILQFNFGKLIRILSSSFFDSITCVNLRGGIEAYVEDSYFEKCSTGLRATTLEGYKGKMRKDPIEVYTSKNSILGTGGWDPSEFIRADGKVTGTSTADTIRSGTLIKNEKGANVVVKNALGD
jgi:hypothetical protein